MEEERYLILKMLEEGKITAEEAAGLIAALEDRQAGGAATGGAGGGAAGPGSAGHAKDDPFGGPGPDWSRQEGPGSDRDRRQGRRHDDRWFDREGFDSSMENVRRDLEKMRLGAMSFGDEISRRVQETLRDQREIWRRGGPRSFRHTFRNIGDVFSIPFGREMHEERFEKEVAVAPDARIDLRDLSGDVRVTAHDQPVVKVKAAKRVWASTVEEACRRAADYEIRVETASDGEIEIGARLADDAPGWLPARCTIDYDVLVPAGARVAISLTNGDVTVIGVRGGVDLRSTNGDVDGKALSGSVVASSTNGNVYLENAEPAQLELKTINGDVRADLASLGAGDHGIHTTRGNIQVSVSPDQPLAFSASTMHGDIDLDFPCTVTSRSATRMEGRTGGDRTGGTGAGGAPSLELRALSGDIVLKARKGE